MMEKTSILTTVQNIFGSNIYKIPDYQRGYAWEKDQITDLLDDLGNIEDNKTHYTGTMVMVNKGEVRQSGEKFTIFETIDGQQRLVTISILLFCIYEEFKEVDINILSKELLEIYGNPEDIAENIFQKYIITGKLNRLILNDDSNDYYCSHIIRDSLIEGIDRPENTSQLNLKNAKKQIKDYLLLYSKSKTHVPDEQFIYLNELKSKITDSLIINKYIVESDAEAGVIFEVMNDRGKQLSQADKIKNYLIYLAYKIENNELATKINRYWGLIFKNLMASKRSSEDEFIRYHWLIYTNEYKEYDIHRRVKDKITLKDNTGKRVDNNKIGEQINDYVESVKEASDIFLELNQPDNKTAFSDSTYHNYEKLYDIREYINKFHRLKNIATFYPLFMSSRRVFKDKPEFFLEILRLSEIFTFRVYVIGNRRSNTKQTAFFRKAYELNENRNKEKKDEFFDEVKNELIEAINDYGSDSEFRKNLSQTYFHNNIQTHEIKYFFYELEKRKAQEVKEEINFSWDDLEGKTQIEHIWSQKPKNYEQWDDSKKELHKNYVNKLGNLTITGWNQKLSNKNFWEKDFTGKKSIYKQSNLRVQEELSKPKYSSWGKKAIENREEELIQFSLNRWGAL